MNIKSVSFGKTVRVRGSFEDALRIANAANGYSANKNFKNRVQKIFDDVHPTGKNSDYAAQVFQTTKGTCYILTGKESQKAYQIRHELLEEAENNAKGIADLFDIELDIADKEIKNRITQLIAETKSPFVVKIAKDANGRDRIHKINLKG